MSHPRVFNWNPNRPVFTGRIGRRIPLQRPVNNFGDLIGPLVVEHMLARQGLSSAGEAGERSLFSVGSVMHFASTGDTVWGTGVNGKVPEDSYTFSELDVRAVRGPLTRRFLLDRGLTVPEVYGDPALLLATLRPDLRELSARKLHPVTVVPNFNDLAHYKPFGPEVLHPQRPLEECLRRIAQSELVVGSSLHGVIVAEAFGVPARLITSKAEHVFKYDDYYQGTGRTSWTAAASVSQALEMGGEAPIDWSPDPLLAAFPYDLWGATSPTRDLTVDLTSTEQAARSV